MAQSEVQIKTPETDPKEIEIYELPDKEIKITLIKILNLAPYVSFRYILSF